MDEHYELAMHLCGISEDDDGSEIDYAIFDKYDIDIEHFSLIVNDLLPLIDVGKSPLTGKTYKGFSVDGVFLAWHLI